MFLSVFLLHYLILCLSVSLCLYLASTHTHTYIKRTHTPLSSKFEYMPFKKKYCATCPRPHLDIFCTTSLPPPPLYLSFGLSPFLSVYPSIHPTPLGCWLTPIMFLCTLELEIQNAEGIIGRPQCKSERASDFDVLMKRLSVSRIVCSGAKQNERGRKAKDVEERKRTKGRGKNRNRLISRCLSRPFAVHWRYHKVEHVWQRSYYFNDYKL